MNTSECIYFDTDNTFDAAMLEPVQIIFMLFLIGLGAWLAGSKKNRVDKDGLDISPVNLRWFGIFLFALGLVGAITGIKNTTDIISISSQKNEVSAIVYSAMNSYNAEQYKPVAKYIIDDEE